MSSIRFLPGLGTVSKAFVRAPDTDDDGSLDLVFLAILPPNEFARLSDAGSQIELWTDILSPSWSAVPFVYPSSPNFATKEYQLINVNNKDSRIQNNGNVTLVAKLSSPKLPSSYSFTFRIRYPSGSCQWLGHASSNGKVFCIAERPWESYPREKWVSLDDGLFVVGRLHPRVQWFGWGINHDQQISSCAVPGTTDVFTTLILTPSVNGNCLTPLYVAIHSPGGVSVLDNRDVVVKSEEIQVSPLNSLQPIPSLLPTSSPDCLVFTSVSQDQKLLKLYPRWICESNRAPVILDEQAISSRFSSEIDSLMICSPENDYADIISSPNLVLPPTLPDSLLVVGLHKLDESGDLLIGIPHARRLPQVANSPQSNGHVEEPTLTEFSPLLPESDLSITQHNVSGSNSPRTALDVLIYILWLLVPFLFIYVKDPPPNTHQSRPTSPKSDVSELSTETAVPSRRPSNDFSHTLRIHQLRDDSSYRAPSLTYLVQSPVVEAFVASFNSNELSLWFALDDVPIDPGSITYKRLGTHVWRIQIATSHSMAQTK